MLSIINFFGSPFIETVVRLECAPPYEISEPVSDCLSGIGGNLNVQTKKFILSVEVVVDLGRIFLNHIKSFLVSSQNMFKILHKFKLDKKIEYLAIM